MRKAYTFLRPISFQGPGIHSGKTATLTLTPAPQGTGFRFIRTDLQNAIVPVLPQSLVLASRSTHLSSNGVTIRTPEHLLSACWALHLTDIDFYLSGEEVPILDGSAKPFVEEIINAGYTETTRDLTLNTVEAPVWIQEGDQQVLILPSDTPQFTYCLSYPQAFIGKQIETYTFTLSEYIDRISAARTYGFMAEIEALRSRGLALGGSLDNAIVIQDTGYLNPLRFENELAAHKLLDLIGDFACLGYRLSAHIIGIKSGHSLHAQAVQHLAKRLPF